MKCPVCNSDLAIDYKFCGVCGAPRPVLPPEFELAQQKYLELRQRHSSGELDDKAFQAELGKLGFQDDTGHYWMLGVESGDWYCLQADRWVRLDPPALNSSPNKDPAAQANNLAPEKYPPLTSSTERISNAQPASASHENQRPPKKHPNRLLLIIAGVLALLCMAVFAAGFFIFNSPRFQEITFQIFPGTATATAYSPITILPAIPTQIPTVQAPLVDLSVGNTPAAPPVTPPTQAVPQSTWQSVDIPAAGIRLQLPEEWTYTISDANLIANQSLFQDGYLALNWMPASPSISLENWLDILSTDTEVIKPAESMSSRLGPVLWNICKGKDGTHYLHGVVASPDGSQIIFITGSFQAGDMDQFMPQLLQIIQKASPMG